MATNLITVETRPFGPLEHLAYKPDAIQLTHKAATPHLGYNRTRK